MIRDLNDIKEPMKGIIKEPDDAKPFWGISSEWNAYDEQEKNFKEATSRYEEKKQIITDLNTIEKEISDAFEQGKNKDGIKKILEEKDFNIEESLIDDYLQDIAQQEAEKKSAQEVLDRLNYNSINNNSSGIDYNNDILKAESRLQGISKNSYDFKKRLEESALKIAIANKGFSSPITDVKEAVKTIEALEELGYNGNLGNLAAIKIMNDQLKSYESKLKEMSQKLENQDKEISDLKSEKETLVAENKGKDEENKNLKDNIESKDSEIVELKSKRFWKTFSEKVFSIFKLKKVESLPSSNNKTLITKSDEIKLKPNITEELKNSVNNDLKTDRNQVSEGYFTHYTEYPKDR
jgi:regulator of replication initiation timing